ncbi:MAG TPA: hypothetical protein GX505_05605 [Clostridiales bacterium]|nr:hypothetical protein [Clostridiales bacterium]
MKSRVLCAVQMNWSADIYRTKETFESKIRGLVEQCRSHSGDGELLIVFPEDVGTPLVLLDAPGWVFRTGSLKNAVTRLTLCHGISTFKNRLLHKTSWVRSLALARADTAARAYFDTFSRLAREYRTTIVAGSILLPDISLQDIQEVLLNKKNNFLSHGSDVYNICYVFGPHGEIIGSQKKVYLVPGLEDKDGFDISNGSLSDLNVIDSPFGRLGIAICLDSFQEDVVGNLAAHGAEILIQPSANCKPWLREEQEGWMESAWRAMDSHNFKFALNPMMTGCLFDLCFEGQSSILQKDYASVQYGYKDLKPDKYFVKIAESWAGEEILILNMSL